MSGVLVGRCRRPNSLYSVSVKASYFNFTPVELFERVVKPSLLWLCCKDWVHAIRTSCSVVFASSSSVFAVKKAGGNGRDAVAFTDHSSSRVVANGTIWLHRFEGEQTKRSTKKQGHLESEYSNKTKVRERPKSRNCKREAYTVLARLELS